MLNFAWFVSVLFLGGGGSRRWRDAVAIFMTITPLESVKKLSIGQRDIENRSFFVLPVDHI